MTLHYTFLLTCASLLCNFILFYYILFFSHVMINKWENLSNIRGENIRGKNKKMPHFGHKCLKLWIKHNIIRYSL